MIAWITARALGVPRWGWAALAVAVLAWSCDRAVDDLVSTAHQAGAAEAEKAGHETTLDQLGKANEAAVQIRDDRGNARYDQCLRDSAPGYESSCERYRADQLVPGR